MAQMPLELAAQVDFQNALAAVRAISEAGFRHDGSVMVLDYFYDAISEAIGIINKDKRAAAEAYLRLANDQKSTPEEIYGIISDKDYHYTLQPQKVLATAQFMAHIGSIKKSPAKIEDLFFPESNDLKGD